MNISHNINIHHLTDHSIGWPMRATSYHASCIMRSCESSCVCVTCVRVYDGKKNQYPQLPRHTSTRGGSDPPLTPPPLAACQAVVDVEKGRRCFLVATAPSFFELYTGLGIGHRQRMTYPSIASPLIPIPHSFPFPHKRCPLGVVVVSVYAGPRALQRTGGICVGWKGS
jgi:hypothetical protein